MKDLRLYVPTLTIVIASILVGCNNPKNMPGYGGCKYVNLIGEYRIDKFEKISDTDYSIRFIDAESLELAHELNQKQVKAQIPEFNDVVMQDTSQIYIISIDAITSGSCTP